MNSIINDLMACKSALEKPYADTSVVIPRKVYNRIEERGLELEEENKRLKAQMEWISVKDRLPKDNEYALVWCIGEFIAGTNIGEECEWYGIGYSYGLKWKVYQCKNIKNIEVLAWMPLPEPYRKDGAADE